MAGQYTESQLLEISRQQYDSLNRTDPITINNKKTVIGYVSEINNKASGEQSYVITDVQLPPDPTPEDLAKVKTVIIDNDLVMTTTKTVYVIA